jgi:3-deoxy-D-arabino-heptulosonate 7-phosphate (DAHP) synthase class II
MSDEHRIAVAYASVAVLLMLLAALALHGVAHLAQLASATLAGSVAR